MKLGGGGGKIPDLPTGFFFPHPAYRKRFFLLKGGLRQNLVVNSRDFITCNNMYHIKAHVIENVTITVVYHDGSGRKVAYNYAWYPGFEAWKKLLMQIAIGRGGHSKG